MADLLFKDVKADEPETYVISLNKLIGQKVKDIYGYITLEFGEPYFQMTRLVLEDGTEIGVEGEHDTAYLSPYPDKDVELHLDEDTLLSVYNSDPDHAAEEEDDEDFDENY